MGWYKRDWHLLHLWFKIRNRVHYSLRGHRLIGIGIPIITLRQSITMTSKWERWRLKSPASRLFTQLFIQAQIKENISAPRYWPLWGEFTVDRWIPAQRASDTENVSIWWRHHDTNDTASFWWMKAEFFSYIYWVLCKVKFDIIHLKSRGLEITLFL